MRVESREVTTAILVTACVLNLRRSHDIYNGVRLSEHILFCRA